MNKSISKKKNAILFLIFIFVNVYIYKLIINALYNLVPFSFRKLVKYQWNDVQEEIIYILIIMIIIKKWAI